MKFNNVLQMLYEHETVDIYEQVSIIKETGAESVSWQKIGSILCNIQADGSFGDRLSASEQGDKIHAVYNLYTQSEIKGGQRVFRDGQFYEIRNVEHNGRGTVLEHYKGYIERVENQ